MLFGLGVVLCCAGLVILMLSRNSSIHSLTLGIGGPLGLLPKMVPFVRALPQHIVSTTEHVAIFVLVHQAQPECIYNPIIAMEFS